MAEEFKKILVVEDDTFLNKAFVKKIASSGFSVVSVSNGIEAVGVAQKEMPDLILLDLMLPGRNGFDILADFKKDEKLKNTPVIIMSNLGQDEEVQRGLSMGASEYLVKTNIRLEDVVDKIRNYLK